MKMKLDKWKWNLTNENKKSRQMKMENFDKVSTNDWLYSISLVQEKLLACDLQIKNVNQLLAPYLAFFYR